MIVLKFYSVNFDNAGMVWSKAEFLLLPLVLKLLEGNIFSAFFLSRKSIDYTMTNGTVVYWVSKITFFQVSIVDIAVNHFSNKNKKNNLIFLIYRGHMQ